MICNSGSRYESHQACIEHGDGNRVFVQNRDSEAFWKLFSCFTRKMPLQIPNNGQTLNQFTTNSLPISKSFAANNFKLFALHNSDAPIITINLAAHSSSRNIATSALVTRLHPIVIHTCSFSPFPVQLPARCNVICPDYSTNICCIVKQTFKQQELAELYYQPVNSANLCYTQCFC